MDISNIVVTRSGGDNVITVWDKPTGKIYFPDGAYEDPRGWGYVYASEILDFTHSRRIEWGDEEYDAFIQWYHSNINNLPSPYFYLGRRE